jgi:hypothetical protein
VSNGCIKQTFQTLVNQTELKVCHLTLLLSKLVLFFKFSVSIAVESAFKMPRQRINSPDSFCYVCGEYTIKSHRQSVTPLVKKGYELYFGCKLTDQDKKWASHICCTNCASRLRGRLKNERKVSLPFAGPIVWRESTNDVNDCYFCMIQIEGMKGKDRKKIEYPNIPSAIIPVSHSDDLPVPVPPQTWSLEEENTDDPMETVHTILNFCVMLCFINQIYIQVLRQHNFIV